jgi:hypothetical protein
MTDTAQMPEGKPDDLGRFKTVESRARALGNLKQPFVEGNIPQGHRRKRDTEAERELNRALQMRKPGDPQRRTYLRKIMEKLAQKAAAGDINAIRIVLDRKLGRIRWSDEEPPPSVIVLQVVRNSVRNNAVEEQTMKSYIQSGQS